MEPIQWVGGLRARGFLEIGQVSFEQISFESQKKMNTSADI